MEPVHVPHLTVRFKKKLVEIPLERMTNNFTPAGHAADEIIQVLGEKYGFDGKTRDALVLFDKNKRLVRIDKKARLT